MTNIADILSIAVQALGHQLSNPRLEAELLLAQVLQVCRSHVYAYPEKKLLPNQIAQLHQLLKRRCAGEPMAYILGEKEFWSLNLHVTPDTLIPRPETELLVELVLQVVHQLDQHSAIGGGKQVADLGTGSGAIALALATECPAWQVTATDSSPAALTVAQENAQRLGITNVIFFQGEWCQALPQQNYQIIVSNPPYIAQADPHLAQADLSFEPQSALVSGSDGLNALRTIIAQAPHYLVSNGWLFLEHGFTQAAAVEQLLCKRGYKNVTSYKDLAGQDRVVAAKAP